MKTLIRLALLLTGAAALVGCGPTAPVAAPGTTSPAATSAPKVVPAVSPVAAPNPIAVAPASKPAVLPVDLSQATFQVPAFPGAEKACPAGERHFVNGLVKFGDAAHTQLRQSTVGQIVYTDLDGRAGKDTVIALTCSNDGSLHPTQLLVLTLEGKVIQPVGFAVNSPDHPNLLIEPSTFHLVGSMLVIEAIGPYANDGWPAGPRQIRGYAFRDGRFRQVSGPVSFPAPPTDIHRADFVNGTVALGTDCGTDGGFLTYVGLTGGVSEKTYYRDCSTGYDAYRVTLEKIGFITEPDGDSAIVRVSLTGDGRNDTQIYALDVREGSQPMGWAPLIQTAAGGPSAIGLVELGAGSVKITYTEDGVTKTRTYHRSENGQTWK
jgi:hypothetical protein